MNFTGGAQIFFSPQIIDKYLSQCTTTEINVEKERFKAMCLFLKADNSRYGYLLEELRK